MHFHGKILGAEIASPVCGATILLKNDKEETLFQTQSIEDGSWHIEDCQDGTHLLIFATGYVEKKISANPLPEVIRLLEDKLIGYQDKLWFVSGEYVQVRVHSKFSYKAQLFRHGLQKKLICDFGKKSAFKQQIPDGFFVEHGLNWKCSFNYTVPAKARPGIYSLLLTAEDGDCFAIPMLISSLAYGKSKKNKLLVLASTNNWLSYNTWGGRSRYRNFEENKSSDFIDVNQLNNVFITKIAKLLPNSIKRIIKKHVLKEKTDKNNWVHKKLSIKRPFIDCALEEDTPFQPFTNHLAAGEWRVLAWLEREGYSYDIISGYELNNNPDFLKDYKAIIFSTHCEYWSKRMYESVNQYHLENGLWLINLSGNTMYREVDFYTDGSQKCVNLMFSESVADETQLLGSRFSMSDYSTCSKYKIVKKNHWAFDGIPINAKSPFFGGTSLNQNTPKMTSRYDPGRPGFSNGLQGDGASGWETDKISKTAPSDMQLLAKGCNKNGGADMLIREPQRNRGGMFTASSLVFGGALLIDNVASMLVKNVINKALKVTTGQEGRWKRAGSNF